MTNFIRLSIGLAVLFIALFLFGVVFSMLVKIGILVLIVVGIVYLVKKIVT